ncbi:hypothetical protein JX265_011882 [Neoarthrinium moseri]|uniref:Rhodopsin domain-containing protein n=1 Tax=Neoarthrinium moseri TaxID=1658444 RepID=A0A9Q0AK86_9PEZI|nr:uncharacterized protein JN550_010402 [Neoarthrinium moseri]KAI1847206.1 hypothetical protein JX266_006746 [Neoarthrinium moseri]KAI1856167.1 hypothetical protein JX265_011882 [Neoarthrinium moseri]KAI1862246.1 hypothetical protein JN550_010402 [Neoarthrinium moseri]
MSAQDPTVSTENNGGALVGTSIAFLILTWLSVFLRTYVRAFMLKGFQADDWLMLVAQANYTISCGFILRGVYYGVGRHNKSLDQYDEIQALKYQALATATYIANMMFIKLSIGIFLLRLATQKRYRYAIYGSIVIVSIWSIVLFFWNLFQCHPFEAQWDYTILQNDPTAFCVSADQIVSAAYALSVMTILSDWFYALIPIPIVWSVKMTNQAKATVIVILSLGVFASIATLIRLKFLADLTDLEDLLFATTDAMVWTLIEPGVAIIASSLVTIRPLLRAWRIRGFQSTENSKRTGPSSYGHHGTNPSRARGMPGFGSKDVAAIDMEAGYARNEGASPSSPTFDAHSKGSKFSLMSRISERATDSPDGTAHPASNGISVHRRIEVRSEVYVIEGTSSPRPSTRSAHHDTWPPNHSPSSSEIELTSMEPVYARSDSGVGLGSHR